MLTYFYWKRFAMDISCSEDTATVTILWKTGYDLEYATIPL